MEKVAEGGVNPYEARARQVKAERLAHYLWTALSTTAVSRAEEIGGVYKQNFWKRVAKEAGVNKPSADTIALVIQILKEQSNVGIRS